MFDSNLRQTLNALFGRMWHSTSCYKEPFATGSPCALSQDKRSSDGCPENAVRRCLVNVWGTVYELDLCESCADYWHGKCVDDCHYRVPKPASQLQPNGV